MIVTSDSLGEILWREYALDWKRINSLLEKKEIEEILADVAEEFKYPSVSAALGLDTSDDLTPEETALFRLKKAASRKMWSGIDKGAANDLIRGMVNVGAESVRMPDGGVYTPEELKEAWRESQEEDRDPER